ncbi:MAG: hypothetical protein ACI4EU_04990 [Butyrivibrio sp.]
MTGNYNLPAGYGGFNQGYTGGQQYMQPSPPMQPQMQTIGQQRPQQQQQSNYSCVPVSSREEAMAVRAELLSMGTIMPDLAHNCIYLKRLNQNTGTAEFFEFDYTPVQQQETPKMQNQPIEYVPKEDFDKLCDVVIKMQKELQNMKGAAETNE